MWCRDVHEILEGDFDRLEAMEEFEQKNFQVIFPFHNMWPRFENKGLVLFI